MDNKDEEPAIDRQRLAEQVIVSAGNVLAAAGFGREEIGHFFRQAADQLAPAAGTATPDHAETSLRTVQAPMEPVLAAFLQSRPVCELQALAAQAQALEPLDCDGPQLKSAFDLAMQMAALLGEAQHGLRTLAREAQIPVFNSRDEWMDEIGTRDLSAASPAICLEDFEPACRKAFGGIGAVLDELARREDTEAFTFLLGQLAENGVVIDSVLRASVERGAALLPG